MILDSQSESFESELLSKSLHGFFCWDIATFASKVKLSV